LNANLEWCLNLQNDCCGVSTESGSDRVTILEISGDPVATALGTDLITQPWMRLREDFRLQIEK